MFFFFKKKEAKNVLGSKNPSYARGPGWPNETPGIQGLTPPAKDNFCVSGRPPGSRDKYSTDFIGGPTEKIFCSGKFLGENIFQGQVLIPGI